MAIPERGGNLNARSGPSSCKRGAIALWPGSDGARTE